MRALMTALAALLLVASGGGVLAETPKLNPATTSGAREAVVHYGDALMRPPFEAVARARATCGRYLETAARSLAAEGAAPCALMQRLVETRAMCAWLAGQDEDALAFTRELAVLRCGASDSGLKRVMMLSERWWRPEIAQAFVAAQRMGAKGRKARVERLEAVSGFVARAKLALGGDYPRRSGGLLILEVPRGSGAARAGLRRGDVVVSVNARPLRRLADLDGLLAHAKRGSSSVLYYRKGERIEGTWPGRSGAQLKGVSLPERLP